jgi:hypothetical protein
MARFVPATSPFPQAGLARLERASRTCGRLTATGALLLALAAVGSLVLRAGTGLREGVAAWTQAQRERTEDRKLWELALSDSRVMADLVALHQDTPRPGSGYF